jgi:hypothetical protein
MVTRPSMHTSQTDTPTVLCPSCAGPALTRREWLDGLRVGDIVACYFDSNRMQNERITSAPKSFVSVGKYSRRVNFRRSDGCMCGAKPLSQRFRIERP